MDNAYFRRIIRVDTYSETQQSERRWCKNMLGFTGVLIISGFSVPLKTYLPLCGFW